MAELRQGRWRATLILTLSRAGMAFQFQSIGAMSSVLIGPEAMSFAFYGWLLGIYLFPGILMSIPGGWLGARFGERRTLLVGIGMMVLSGAAAVLFGGTDGALPNFWNYAPRVPHGIGARVMVALLVVRKGQ